MNKKKQKLMETKFIALLADIIKVNANEINLHDKFREYENWDSLSYLSVIAMLDEEFEIQIETKDFKTLITVEDLINKIKEG